MFSGFLVLILGIILILLSYFSLKFGTTLNDRFEKNKKRKKSRIRDEFLIPSGVESVEVIRYVFGSVLLFIMGLIIAVVGILSIVGIGKITWMP